MLAGGWSCWSVYALLTVRISGGPEPETLGAQCPTCSNPAAWTPSSASPACTTSSFTAASRTAGLRHVLARHEQGAGFMADGYARATGRPGVCYLISGPGLLECRDRARAGLLATACPCWPSPPASTRRLRGAVSSTRCATRKARAARSATGPKPPAMPHRPLRWWIARWPSSPPPAPARKALHVPIAGLPPPPARHPTRPRTRRGPVPRTIRSRGRGGRARRPPAAFRLRRRRRGAAPGRAGELLRQTGAAAFTTVAGRGWCRRTIRKASAATCRARAAPRIAAEADLILALGTELSECDLWRRASGP